MLTTRDARRAARGVCIGLSRVHRVHRAGTPLWMSLVFYALLCWSDPIRARCMCVRPTHTHPSPRPREISDAATSAPLAALLERDHLAPLDAIGVALRCATSVRTATQTAAARKA